MDSIVNPQMHKWISPLIHIDTEAVALLASKESFIGIVPSIEGLTEGPCTSRAVCVYQGLQNLSTSSAMVALTHKPKTLNDAFPGMSDIFKELGQEDEEFSSDDEDKEGLYKSGAREESEEGSEFEETEGSTTDEDDGTIIPSFLNESLLPQLTGREMRTERDGDEEHEIDLVSAPFGKDPKPLQHWVELDVKSGPHRLLSEEKKFSSWCDRAYEEKTKRENAYAEKSKEKIMQAMGIDEQTFKMLQDQTTPSLGAVRGESFKDRPVGRGTDMPVLIPPIPDADSMELKSMSVLFCSANSSGMLWRSNNVQQQINDDLKYKAALEKLFERQRDYAKEDLCGLVNVTKDILIQVSVYAGKHPGNSLPPGVKVNTEPKLAYKLELLGTNTVADLRNALHCEQDFIATDEVQNPEDARDREAIMKNKDTASSMILIHNIIYSKGEGIDFATELNTWSETNPLKNLRPFEMGDSNTCLKDLTLRMGYPYVYIHVGKCEHILVFNHIRLHEERDEHRIANYPRISTIPAVKNVYCRVDNEHMATWQVVDCTEFPENPMLLCTWCLKKFCYMEDGVTKQLSFRLYPYRQLANEI